MERLGEQRGQPQSQGIRLSLRPRTSSQGLIKPRSKSEGRLQYWYSGASAHDADNQGRVSASSAGSHWLTTLSHHHLAHPKIAGFQTLPKLLLIHQILFPKAQLSHSLALQALRAFARMAFEVAPPPHKTTQEIMDCNDCLDPFRLFQFY